MAQCNNREFEFAIRTALGGGRTRLLRQLLTESAVVAALGTLGGIALAAYALDLVAAFGPADVPRLRSLNVNTRILGFTILLGMVTALGFGAVPAIRTIRGRANALTHGHRSGTAPGPLRLRRGLVATEVALALVLLVGAGLLVRSFTRLVDVDLGFAAANTIAVQVVAWNRHDDGAARVNFFRQTLEEIQALPGIEAAGAVSSFPLAVADFTIESQFTIPGQPPPPPGEQPSTAVTAATPTYLPTMRIP